MTKLTKKVALECALCAVAGNPLKEYRSAVDGTVFTAEEVTAKLNEMWAALDKKSGTEKPMTENQKQNVGFKDNILATLSDGKKRTATEILKETPEFPKDMSNQRVSALLRQLYLVGKVQKETVKG
ncbi:MAG: hypothetical protein IKZ00_03360, partial [Bacteroidaceae bacterium]|nr:hypothetical protein [Bacteroidaceae bacterium]